MGERGNPQRNPSRGKPQKSWWDTLREKILWDLLSENPEDLSEEILLLGEIFLEETLQRGEPR